MKTTINKSQFRDSFIRMDRQANFSYEALGLLFDYFEDLDEDMELDVIAICCEYVEMTPEELAESYDLPEDADDDAIYNWLSEQTQVIGITKAGDYVFAQF